MAMFMGFTPFEDMRTMHEGLKVLLTPCEGLPVAPMTAPPVPPPMYVVEEPVAAAFVGAFAAWREASSNKCHASSNRCPTSSDKKLVVTSATLVV